MKALKAAGIAAVILMAASSLSARADAGVRLLLAVTWEGRDLDDYNLKALQTFREQYPELKLVHFISPAYFLRGDPQAPALVQAAIRQGDQLGLNLGGWKSLASKAQVSFRDGPTFWGENLRAADCEHDCGVDVALAAYTDEEQANLLAAGLQVLQANDFKDVDALTTTGWLAAPPLLKAAAKSGIRYDFSAVAPLAVLPAIGRFPLYPWIVGHWPKIATKTQPYIVETAPLLIEVPQTAAAIDYLDEKQALELFREAVARARQAPQHEQLFFLGAYQETAYAQLPRLSAALKSINAEAAGQNIEVSAAALADLPSLCQSPAPSRWQAVASGDPQSER